LRIYKNCRKNKMKYDYKSLHEFKNKIFRVEGYFCVNRDSESIENRQSSIVKKSLLN
jgi:hypothetical protein